MLPGCCCCWCWCCCCWCWFFLLTLMLFDQDKEEEEEEPYFLYPCIPSTYRSCFKDKIRHRGQESLFPLELMKFIFTLSSTMCFLASCSFSIGHFFSVVPLLHHHHHHHHYHYHHHHHYHHHRPNQHKQGSNTTTRAP